MKRRYFLLSIFITIVCVEAFTQNRLSNTTWETVTDTGTRQTIVFGENGFKWTGDSWKTDFGNIMPGRNEVGTYRIQGEMIYLSIPGFTYTGILLGNTLNISANGLVGWEFKRVQPGSSSQNNSNQNSSTSELPLIHQNIETAMRRVATDMDNKIDVNNDGKIDCIDAAVQFYKYYPDKYKVCIITNLNYDTGMNHVFNAVFIDGRWRTIEPQSYRSRKPSYWMTDVWGSKYDSSKDEDATAEYKKYVK